MKWKLVPEEPTSEMVDAGVKAYQQNYNCENMHEDWRCCYKAMTDSAPQPEHYIVTAYWLEYYVADHCTLCGNHGWIDTRGTRTPAGKEVGRVNYCICPNGQMLRAGGAELPNVISTP